MLGLLIQRSRCIDAERTLYLLVDTLTVRAHILPVSNNAAAAAAAAAPIALFRLIVRTNIARIIGYVGHQYAIFASSNAINTGHFSGPGTAIGQVCLSVSEQK